MSFELSDKLICIDNDGLEHLLTVGQTYKVLSVESSMVQVMDDNSVERFINNVRFKLHCEAFKFKAGDVVINSSDKDDDLTIGKPYRLTGVNSLGDLEFYDDIGDYRTRPGHYYMTVGEYERDLRSKVHSLKNPEPKVGDKYSYVNDIYTIIETHVNGKTLYALMCDDGNIWAAFSNKINVPTAFRTFK